MPAGDIFILVVKKTKSIRRAKSLMGKSWDYQKQISHDDIHKRGNQCQIHFKYVYEAVSDLMHRDPISKVLS